MDKFKSAHDRRSISKITRLGKSKRVSKGHGKKNLNNLINGTPRLLKTSKLPESDIAKTKLLIEAASNLVLPTTSKNLKNKMKSKNVSPRASRTDISTSKSSCLPIEKNKISPKFKNVKQQFKESKSHKIDCSANQSVSELTTKKKNKKTKRKDKCHRNVKQESDYKGGLNKCHKPSTEYSTTNKRSKSNNLTEKKPKIVNTKFSMANYKVFVSNHNLNLPFKQIIYDPFPKSTSSSSEFSDNALSLNEIMQNSFEEYNKSSDSVDEKALKALSKEILQQIPQQKTLEEDLEQVFNESENTGRYVRFQGKMYSESSPENNSSTDACLRKTNNFTKIKYDKNEVARNIESKLLDGEDPNRSENDISIVEINSSDSEDDCPKNTALKMIMHTNIEKNNVELFFGKYKKVIKLSHPCKIYFNGKLDTTLLYGVVKVLGYDLHHDKTYSIYSPRGTGLLCFETCNDSSEFNPLVLFKKLETSGLGPYDIETIVTSLSQNDAVLYIDDINNCLTKTLECIPQVIFPTSNSITDTKRSLYEYEEALQCKLYKPNEHNKLFTQGPTWDEIDFEQLAQGGKRIVVCGGKSVGKSTFLRYCTNKIVDKTSVIIIDLDVGQSEFFMPGTISVLEYKEPLLGPSFTHTQTDVLKSVFYREIDVQNPDKYINSVKILLEFLKDKKYHDLPWIINTMGFTTKGSGEDIMIYLIQLIKPTNVIQINSIHKHKNYSNLLKQDVVNSYSYTLNFDNLKIPVNYEYILLNSAINEMNPDFNIKAKLSRELNVLGYMSHAILSDCIESIKSVKPKLLSMNNIKIWSLSKPYLAAKELNGSLVALCTVNEDISVINEGSLQVLPNDMDIAPNCIGFGIVRGVDDIDKKFCIITPLSDEQILKVTCIAKCVQILPSTLFLNQDPTVKGNIPYVTGARVKLPTGNTPKRNYGEYRKTKNEVEDKLSNK